MLDGNIKRFKWILQTLDYKLLSCNCSLYSAYWPILYFHPIFHSTLGTLKKILILSMIYLLFSSMLLKLFESLYILCIFLLLFNTVIIKKIQRTISNFMYLLRLALCLTIIYRGSQESMRVTLPATHNTGIWNVKKLPRGTYCTQVGTPVAQ